MNDSRIEYAEWLGLDITQEQMEKLSEACGYSNTSLFGLLDFLKRLKKELVKPVDPSRLSFLVLDFSRPTELKLTLESIKKHCKCEHEVVCHANGGNQSYHVEFYNAGLIDRLILNKLNNGAGRGCVDLFNYCLTDFAIYLEGDQPLIRDLTEEEWRRWAKLVTTTQNKFVSMVGLWTRGEFSQRAFFTQVEFYRQLARGMPNGGPGTDRKNDTNEHFVQEYIKNTGQDLFTPPRLVNDLGLYSVNENPDGSVFLHCTDTRQVWLIKGPVKERANYPNFTDEEWKWVLTNQSWVDGHVPMKDVAHSFVYFKDRNDKEVVEQLRKSYA